VVQLVHGDAALHKIRVSVEADSGLPPVQGDKIQLQQVVLNLLMNAFDAMRDCPATERNVVVRAEMEGTRIIKVSARDRGTGLSAGNLDRIFRPFFTTKREGLGMGLSISRAIIEAHGGRLWAENNPDRGASFYFTVPLGSA
jgi:two-component system sensor kinase FixL